MRTSRIPQIRPERSSPIRRRRGQRASILAAAVVIIAGLVLPAGQAAASPAPPPPASGRPDLGANVIIFSPTMPQSQIQATVDSIAAQQLGNQFGTQRYALLFQPGIYGSVADPLTFDVGYYTQVAGLGSEPTAVTINGSINVHNQCNPDGTCFALNNFWRSLSNLTINVTGGSGCQQNTEFWAVSQAAPMRRVNINGLVSLMDYCSAGPQFASGGFIADSKFTGARVINGSQQQFIVRNSDLDGWSNGVWNQVFSGDIGAPAQQFPGILNGPGPYTTLATSPVTADAPYLYADAAGSLRVMVPAVAHDSVGPSWAAGTAGTSRPIQDFLIADPSTPVSKINAALARGRSLLLTPGVYDLRQTIEINRSDAVVLGLGFPTLVPRQGHVTMKIGNVGGTKLAGIIFDAGVQKSPVLLQVGKSADSERERKGRPAAITQIQDVFFRVGGAAPGQARTSVVVNNSDVLLDDIWAWRADHGAGVGWTQNKADTGLVVNGDHVTAYGLFVEHFQKTEVIWNGNGGRVVFFQNEMPYDPPSQAAWRASRTFNGYPAFLIAPEVKTFQGYGMGSYSFFNQNVDIHASTAFQVPQAPGVRLHDLLTVFLNGAGAIDSVVNGTGAAVTTGSRGPSTVVSYP